MDESAMLVDISLRWGGKVRAESTATWKHWRQR